MLRSPLESSVTSRFGGLGRARSRLFLGVAFVASVPFLLTSFAASVTVGTGALNFGQGSQQAVACDSQVYIALSQEWYSSPTPEDGTNGYFRVKSVTVSGLDLLACQKTKLRVRLINNSGQEIPIGPEAATVIQMAIPTTEAPINSSDPVALGLSYLTGDGRGISAVNIASVALSVSGISIYDGTVLSPNSADVTFYLDPSSQFINIDGAIVGRTTVESVNNPGV